MQLDREKVLKLIIVVLATLAALAVMSTLVQLIQTVLPFLIVGAGILAAYRWALNEAPAPTADEVEEQARGLFSRFRRTKKAVEATVKVGEALTDLRSEPEQTAAASVEKKHRRRRPMGTVVAGEATKATAAKADGAPKADAQVEAIKQETISEMKQSLDSNPTGNIEFKDRDVVISADDVVQPDISRLEEKEKETPEVNKNVLAQIEERRRRLQGG